MFHPTLSKTGRVLFAPLIKFCEYLGTRHPVMLLKLRYLFVFRKPLDLKNPGDLNEKILWAKLYSDTSRWVELADKLKVRDYVKKMGLGNLMVKLYAVWFSVEDIDTDVLPDSFIIKANNGDGKGTNKIIRKSVLHTDGVHTMEASEKEKLVETVDEWLHRKNIGALSAEPQYREMTPCVVVEEALKPPEGESSLTDYKLWCFNGVFCYVMVCSERGADGSSASVLMYDREWNPHPEFSVFNSDYPRGKVIPRPKNWEQMISVAERLSQGFPEVRVDLYNIDGKIYFGELTFTSQGGFMDYFTPEFNKMLGEKFDIADFPRKNCRCGKDGSSVKNARSVKGGCPVKDVRPE